MALIHTQFNSLFASVVALQETHSLLSHKIDKDVPSVAQHAEALSACSKAFFEDELPDTKNLTSTLRLLDTESTKKDQIFITLTIAMGSHTSSELVESGIDFKYPNNRHETVPDLIGNEQFIVIDDFKKMLKMEFVHLVFDQMSTQGIIEALGAPNRDTIWHYFIKLFQPRESFGLGFIGREKNMANSAGNLAIFQQIVMANACATDVQGENTNADFVRRSILLDDTDYGAKQELLAHLIYVLQAPESKIGYAIHGGVYTFRKTIVEQGRALQKVVKANEVSAIVDISLQYWHSFPMVVDQWIQQNSSSAGLNDQLNLSQSRFDTGAKFFIALIHVSTTNLCVRYLKISFEYLDLTCYTTNEEAIQFHKYSGKFFLVVFLV